MKSALQFAFLGLLFTLATCKFSIDRFQGAFTPKPPSGMYDIGGLGFDGILDGNQIIAYGDFNNDKYTDIVSIADDLRTLMVFTYLHDDDDLKRTFVPLTTIALTKTIASVITGDFNYDGKLDLLIVTLAPDLKTTHLEYFIQSGAAYYFGKQAGQATLTYDLAGQVQPFVLDVKGNRKLDIMFLENGLRTIQTLENGALVNSLFSEYVSYTTDCMSPASVINANFATPHSNAFVDFDGDCAADLFITSVDANDNLFAEVWLRDANSNFCLVQVEQVQFANTSGISAVSLGDMDGNGRVDLVFASIPEDASEPMNLHVLYNTISVDADTPCKVRTTKDIPFTAESFNSLDTVTGVRQVVQILGAYSNATRLFSPDPINRPPKIRVGDINIDGYLDLLFVINDPENSENLYGSIVLSISDGTTFSFIQNATATENTGYYKLLDEETLTATGDLPLAAIPTLYASFFDFDEAGHLGMWVVTASSTSPASTLIAAFNFVATQNFILKTLGLNGVIPKEVDDITSSLGGIYYGASFECRVTDMSAKVSLYKGIQMPQSSYTPLDLPYMYVGIGKTSNYVESFVMGISGTTGSAADVQQTAWTPIIPNSQLIVNPLVDKAWTLDVFVNPTTETTLIGVVVLVILILLGAIVIYLQSEETKKDIETVEREDPWIKLKGAFNKM